MKPTETLAPLTQGSTVFIDGAEALITRVADPRDPRSQLDVIAYTPLPRFTPNVAWGWEAGGWLRPSEWEAGRPKSDLDLVQEAVGRGDPHAPQVGMEVTFGWNASATTRDVCIVPTRAKIKGVKSMKEVYVDVYAPEPPADPMEPDEPIFRMVNKLAHHVSAQTPYQAKLGHPDGWCWPDEGLIRPFGPFEKADIHPPYKCGKCEKGIKRYVPIYLGRDPRQTNIFEDTSDIKVCESCNDELRDFLGLPAIPKKPPAASPEPAVDGEMPSARSSEPLGAADPELARLLCGPDPIPGDPGYDDAARDAEFSLNAAR